MKLLLDANIARHVVADLKADGHDVLSMLAVEPAAEDIKILHLAVEQKRLLITHDKDFGDLVFRDRVCHAGVVLLRTGDEVPESQTRVIRQFLSDYKNEIAKKHFWVVTNRGVRRA